MSKTIAVFGAGLGLGTAVAHRFGREGYQVALVARRPAPLAALKATLASEGIEAEAFPADLSRPQDMAGLVESIRARFGRIDILEYAPISTTPFIPAASLTSQQLADTLNLHALTLIELVQIILPEMIDRGDGAILLGEGSTAVQGRPYMSGVGPAMAAARNYIYSLHGELAPKGIYAGALTVSGLIAGSEGHRAITSGAVKVDLPSGATLPTIDPNDLAEIYWDLVAKRDRVEVIHPPLG